MAVSNIKALIPGELQKVWELVLNTENYAAWRSDLSKTEAISDKQFITAKGDETEIDFTEQVKAKKWLLKPFVKSYLRKQQTQFVADIMKNFS